MIAVQFSRLEDFITDLEAGNTSAVYYELIDQRISTSDYGLSRWQLTTIIRAIVAEGGRIIHGAALTIPHGRPAQLINGTIMDSPLGDKPDRWDAARDAHNRVMEEVMHRLGKLGLINMVRPGVLALPNDLPLLFADNPVPPEEELKPSPFEGLTTKEMAELFAQSR